MRAHMKKATISLIMLTMLSLPPFGFTLIGRAQECPDIQDLTFNISEVGSPSEPRSINDYGYQSNPLEYDETSYYTYKQKIHNVELIVAYHKDIKNLDDLTKSNFSQYAFNVWNYYWNIFQGFPFDKYTILFLNGPLLHNTAFSIGYEVEYPFIDCCSPFCRNYISHSHEIFHAWNSGAFGALNAKDELR